MKSVMIYRAVEDFLPLARENGAAHVARCTSSATGENSLWSARSTSR
jgi:hypothetical protein